MNCTQRKHQLQKGPLKPEGPGTSTYAFYQLLDSRRSLLLLGIGGATLLTVRDFPATEEIDCGHTESSSIRTGATLAEQRTGN